MNLNRKQKTAFFGVDSDVSKIAFPVVVGAPCAHQSCGPWLYFGARCVSVALWRVNKESFAVRQNRKIVHCSSTSTLSSVVFGNSRGPSTRFVLWATFALFWRHFFFEFWFTGSSVRKNWFVCGTLLMVCVRHKKSPTLTFWLVLSCWYVFPGIVSSYRSVRLRNTLKSYLSAISSSIKLWGLKLFMV